MATVHGDRTDPRHERGVGLASPPDVPAPFPGETPQWAAGFTDGSVLPRRSPCRWTPVINTVLGYGLEGAESVLHARVWEAPALAGEPGPPPPVVLLGQFGYHRGQSVTNSICEAAAAAQAQFYPAGQMMRLALRCPHARHCLGEPYAPMLVGEVSFDQRVKGRGAGGNGAGDAAARAVSSATVGGCRR